MVFGYISNDGSNGFFYIEYKFDEYFLKKFSSTIIPILDPPFLLSFIYRLIILYVIDSTIQFPTIISLSNINYIYLYKCKENFFERRNEEESRERKESACSNK